ncbi:MAG: hypothetical protein IPK13_07410 [Deltaproteobacteria bacterium]|nr:hypothetical protein [Deltaproteobacteria bacterium]
MSDDREKKSWREIDATRDRRGGGRSGRRADPDERLRERASQSAAYSKYKSNLDKLFTPGGGGALPENLRAQLGPADESSAARRKALEDLKQDPSEATLAAYLATGAPLPDDARLLMGLLDIREEAQLRPLLSRLLEIVEDGKKPNRMLLIQKVTALRHRVEAAETVELLDMLLAALG